jgi:hypothetical protein
LTDPWAEAQRLAVEYRKRGLTYEDIAEMLSGDRYDFTPWWVYAQCHPEKSTTQIRAWKRKHHPEGWHSRGYNR